MSEYPLWVALTFVWLGAFLFGILVVTRLNSLWLICVLDIGLTVFVVATAAYLKSWSTDETANRELLIVFFLMGALTFAVSLIVLILQTLGGVQL